MNRVIAMSHEAPYRPPLEKNMRLSPDASITGPLVSCLMVSRGDCFPASFAIDCYRRQSYANRELIIVTAQRDSAVGALVATLDDPSIRYFEVEGRTLGELRNASVAQARGSLVCLWDDDDLSDRDRLSIQFAALGTTNSKACFLSHILMWWPERQWLRISPARKWEGSMMADRSIIPVYPALTREEDLYIVRTIAHLHDIVTLNLPSGYCYVAHGSNTNQSAHFEDIFQRSSFLPDTDDYQTAMTAMGGSLPLEAYAAALAVACPAAQA